MRVWFAAGCALPMPQGCFWAAESYREGLGHLRPLSLLPIMPGASALELPATPPGGGPPIFSKPHINHDSEA